MSYPLHLEVGHDGRGRWYWQIVEDLRGEPDRAFDFMPLVQSRAMRSEEKARRRGLSQLAKRQVAQKRWALEEVAWKEVQP